MILFIQFFKFFDYTSEKTPSNVTNNYGLINTNATNSGNNNGNDTGNGKIKTGW